MFRIGDYVGAKDDQDHPIFGRLDWQVLPGLWMIKVAEGHTCGPWEESDIWHDPSYHVDYPHHPGTLYDCPACEASGELDQS